MVKPRRGKKGEATGSRYPPPNLSESEVVLIEKETMERVSDTISALEGAMASWEISKDKPEELRGKFAKYKVVHEALSNWQTKALKSYGKSDVGERVRLLWEFVELCKSHIPEARGA
jgi:hypothetical protein